MHMVEPSMAAAKDGKGSCCGSQVCAFLQTFHMNVAYNIWDILLDMHGRCLQVATHAPCS